MRLRFRNMALIAALLSSPLMATAGKSVIAIVPFTHTVDDGVSQFAARNAMEIVSDVIAKSNRATVADRTKLDHLAQEREIEKREDFLSSANLVEQGKLLGAQYVLAGNVDSADVTANRDERGQAASYAATVVLSLKVIDIETGAVAGSDKYEVSSGAGGGVFGAMLSFAKSPQDAIRKALGDVPKKMMPFVMRTFTLSFSLAEISESQGDAATQVLLAGGSGAGLKKGDVLKVVEIATMEVEGKPLVRKKDVGDLVVETVEDENFSICGVSRGGPAIAEKMAAKAKLRAVPGPAPAPQKK